MTTAAIGYVSLQGLGNEPACFATMNALVSEIRGFNDALGAQAANYAVSVMSGPGDAEDRGLDSERYLPFTGGVFPMVYVSLAYDPQKLPEHQIAEWERKYDLKVTGRIVSPIDVLSLEPPPPNP